MRRLILRIVSAVKRGPRESPSPPTVRVSPAVTVEYVSYSPVAVPDAIAELSYPTGDEARDDVHSVLIDCLQHNLITAYRDSEGDMRFGMTPEGRSRVNKFLGLE